MERTNKNSMTLPVALPVPYIKGAGRQLSSEIRTELIRKSIHLSIAATPTIAAVFGVVHTAFFLMAGVILYTAAEYFRLSGFKVPVISRITELSMRTRDQSQFVLGPVTLGLGAIFALSLYPEPSASIAIYALAFGDGLSSLVGKTFGTIKVPYTGGKTVEGSLTCFLAVLFSGLLLVHGLQPRTVVLVAIIATALEAIPSRDLDNLILPLGAGLAAFILA